MPSLVVFDLDNTLVHSRIDFLGIRQTVVARLVEVGAIHDVPQDLRTRAIPEWLALAEQHDAALGRELWDVVEEYERQGMLHGTVEEDARPTLEALRNAGIRLAVLTNNALHAAEAALDRFGLRDPLDAVFGRGNLPALKPDGAGLAHAARHLDGSPTWLVGDSVIDALAVQRAGVDGGFIGFRSDQADLERRGVLPETTKGRIDCLADLPLLLERLECRPNT